MQEFALFEPQDSAEKVDELTVHVMAAELHLTYFARRHGKESPIYMESLTEFATAWYLLKKNRQPEEFLKDVANF